MCHQEPLVEVWIPGKARLTYGKVSPDTAESMLAAIDLDMIPDGALFKTPLEAIILLCRGR